MKDIPKTLPYNYTPRSYQVPLLRALDEGCTRAIIVWHRRSGKDLTLLNYVAKRMAEKVGIYYYFFPTYAQGKKVIWQAINQDGFKLTDHFPDELVTSRNESEMKITYKNGSIFQIVGTDNIDSVVGSNPIFCVFSEYSLQDPKAWQFVSPILAENKGTAVFNFTPRGTNHAFKLLTNARSDPSWFTQVLTVDDTQAIDVPTLEGERRDMPEDTFLQEYYCKFIDGASQFFRGVSRCLYDGKLPPFSKHRYTLGVDLAKYRDFTVLTPFDLTTFQAGKQDRFNQIDYNLQKARIEAYYYKYYKPKTQIDSTGVGEPVYDDLKARGMQNLEPFHFTEKSRYDLLNNLRLLLEQSKIQIPDDPILLGELSSFQYSIGGRGREKITVPEGMHDDTVFSLALAVWGIPSEKVSESRKEERELIKQFDSMRNKKRPYLSGARRL